MDEAEEFLLGILGPAGKLSGKEQDSVDGTIETRQQSKLDSRSISIGPEQKLPRNIKKAALGKKTSLDSKKPTNVVDNPDVAVESDTLLIYGLGPQSTLQGIEESLFRLQAAYERVKLVQSAKGPIAFVKFFHVSLATEWMNRVNSSLMINNFSCTVQYSIPVQDGKNDWNCSQCNTSNYKNRHRCHVCGLPKNVDIDMQVFLNFGTRDIGNVPNRVVLMRGLPQQTPPSVLYDLLSEILEPECVLLVNQKSNHSFLGFAFAVFKTKRDARRIIGVVINARHPRKIICYDREVTLTFAHMGAFIPASQDSIFVSFKDKEGMCYKYWDESSYCESYPPII